MPESMNCRVCDSDRLEPAIDLGRQPWCNHFLKKEELGREPFYPLRVVFCRDCSTAQLDITVPKEIMFGGHTYLSGISRSLSEHFRTVAEEVDARYFSGSPAKAVLDIGSNDGTQLKHFKNLGYGVLGVESSPVQARMANEAGVETVQAFFNRDLAQGLGRTFEVVNAAGVLFHLEDLHSACDGIREALKADGVFVIQFLYMKALLENKAFDQIYHEHLLYYNLQTLEGLLNRHGLALFDANLSPIHGGSIIAFAGHRGRRRSSPQLRWLRREEDAAGCNTLKAYLDFAKELGKIKKENLDFLAQSKRRKKRIFGFGAPAKGNTLLNYFGIGPETLECLVEKNELRRGLYSPGRHIPVVLESELREPPDVYYVLAWNYKMEILENNRRLVEKGVEFYFPVNPRGG